MINEKEIRDISLEDIIPNRFQPREVFNEESLNELASSIKEHGVIQPIVVRQVGDKFEIIAGERRYKASQLAGKTTIPCIVRELDDVKSSKIALLENLQRKDLTPIEEARTYQTILKIGGMTQDELATSLGKSQSAVANKLRLLALDIDVQNALLSEQISERHARSLLNVTDKIKQKELLDLIVKNRLTVKELDGEIAKQNGNQAITNNFIGEISDDGANGTTGGQIIQPVTQNMNVDVDQIKKQAVDINPQTNFANLNELLKTAPVIEDKPINNNMFIPNIPQEQTTAANEDTETLDIIEPMKEATTTENNQIPETPSIINNNMYQQATPDQPHDLRFAINNIRQSVQATEKFGFVIDTEEFDFENMYQIVIKIDKNK